MWGKAGWQNAWSSLALPECMINYFPLPYWSPEFHMPPELPGYQIWAYCAEERKSASFFLLAATLT
jgi:hypothetical protein